MPVSQVVRQGAGLMEAVSLVSRVNLSGSDSGGLGFRLAGQLFRDAAVRTSFLFPLHSISIDESEIPNAAAFSEGCHPMSVTQGPAVSS